MNEDFFQNFWVSWYKPDNLPDNWLWVEDVFDITTLVEAYRILYPKGKALDDIHYICLPVQDKPIIDFIYSDVGFLNYIFIWRPSAVDKPNPNETTDVDDIKWDEVLFILDNSDYWDDDEEEDYEEEEEDFDE